MSDQQSVEHLVLLLSSGQTLKVQQIELYPAEDLAKIAGLRVEAARGLGGVSSGLGLIGSPGWVVGATAALGFLESVLSEASKKSAIRLLAQAEEMAAAARLRGQLFHIEDIEQIDRPVPTAWRRASTVLERVYTGHMSWKQLAEFLATHGKTDRDLVGNHLSIETKKLFVHPGEDFVVVDTEQGLISIRWSGVVGYIAPSRHEH
ncbi:hypothetical protein KUL72_23805 [Bradyrhizobium arachidis]|uniref:hypothetical protein n=1 Tax=Bradyrhizobium arachidis TaxID=858423 RepID=UPI0021614E63|nr:hypothetical protein [Bradyrhizobium arachidis]UVO34506.1 hypothetical protein KUL72_23805 [Bradyrhizobium arachidis]